ncbi:uncharacterized protein PFL1_06779 [Pseudozyma flocculosa PF-1]|uniref:Related to NHP6B - nonhistone chromosomal protein n=2 Tax=Pseudozyma flocculosa TaxID=84751 RepID=A0A5C3FCG5_9BASI|nr:uncharacterized protein PFL1_06779 [Pseudozyma flocculosa PF-1]EPQ25642.1 hypothetical protein PFL1_06779 [Pseudozyma flocculosa PF-1]SPO42048.1 related to NHP6B - nonhistone chromosomal protein [Pseudozyma flocculosa]
MQNNFDYGLPLAAHHHTQPSHHQHQHQQQQASHHQHAAGNFGMSHAGNQSDDIFIARQTMFDAVSRLSAQLRHAADSCDAFVKAVARQNPSVAAIVLAQPGNVSSGTPGPTTAGGSGVPAAFDFLASMANGATTNVAGPSSDSGQTGSPGASTPTSKKVKPMTKAQKRREKKAKDPEAPKRPPSAYLLFQNEVRQEVRKKHAGLSYPEVLGKVSEAWKALTDEQRKIYQDKTVENMAAWSAMKKEHESQQAANESMEQ